MNAPRTRQEERTVTAAELAADPQLMKDFWRAVRAPMHDVPIGGPIRPARWDEPFDWFESDHRRQHPTKETHG